MSSFVLSNGAFHYFHEFDIVLQFFYVIIFAVSEVLLEDFTCVIGFQCWPRRYMCHNSMTSDRTAKGITLTV